MVRGWWTFSNKENPIAVTTNRAEVERREKELGGFHYFVIPKVPSGEFIISVLPHRAPKRCECTRDEFWYLFELNGNLRIVMHRDPPHVFHIAWKSDFYVNRQRFLQKQPVWVRRQFYRRKYSVNPIPWWKRRK